MEINERMSKIVYKITEQFEQKICDYTGAPFCVAVDNCSNALFLALMYVGIKDKVIVLPSHTYPSVPNEVIHAGGRINWRPSPKYLTGAYQLFPTNVIDSALRFTADMYVSKTFMCLSFSGAYKHLKLIKGGAILTDSEDAYKWFKKARFSGRSECSYHDDNFDENPVLGWNFYMMPEISARGLVLMNQFYDANGEKLANRDISLPYPDLSKFELWNT